MQQTSVHFGLNAHQRRNLLGILASGFRHTRLDKQQGYQGDATKHQKQNRDASLLSRIKVNAGFKGFTIHGRGREGILLATQRPDSKQESKRKRIGLAGRKGFEMCYYHI